MATKNESSNNKEPHLKQIIEMIASRSGLLSFCLKEAEVHHKRLLLLIDELNKIHRSEPQPSVSDQEK